MSGCTKCKISMKKRKHTVGRKHKAVHGRKKRSRIGAISKDALSDTAVIAGTALGTSLALGYLSPMVDNALSSVLPDGTDSAGNKVPNPTRGYLLAGSKIALGLVIGGNAKGSSAKVMEGVGVGMVLNGGGSILGALLGKGKVAGLQPTIGAYRHRVRGVLPTPPTGHSQPVVTSHATIGKMKMGGI